MCLQQQCCNLLLWAPKINVSCLCAVWNRPMADFTDIWQHSQLLSVQTYSSWANSGITRNVRQPWRFLDLRISPKMWSPMYKISFPFAPSRSHITSEEPGRRCKHIRQKLQIFTYIYIRHTQYTEKSCIMNSLLQYLLFQCDFVLSALMFKQHKYEMLNILS